MAATAIKTLTLTLSSLLLLIAAAESSTVHDLLPQYGLPRGLIPDAVESYSLSPETGDFVLEITSTCYVHFSRLVFFEKRVTGKISYGKITDITGIQAKKLFLWVSLSGIVARPESNEIEFQVGVLSETLSASEFETVKECKSKANGCRGVDGVLREIAEV